MNTTESRYAPYTLGSIISADGTTIGYRQIGSGPGLVLLHGAMTSGQDFTSLAEGLADAFTTYLPDRRGRGLSGPFGADYSMQKDGSSEPNWYSPRVRCERGRPHLSPNSTYRFYY